MPPALTARLADVESQFVDLWGTMSSLWGINPTMARIHGLLYITGEALTMDDMMLRLGISRGNVSMNLRELMSWGVVHKVHRQGERREFYRAEADVWTLFRRILSERKRRELDPTLVVLERTVALIEEGPDRNPAQLDRIASLRRFFSQIDHLATRLLTLEPDDLDALLRLFDPLVDDVDEDPASPG